MLLIPGFLFLNFLIRFIFENVFFTVFRSVWMLHIFVHNLNLFQQIFQRRFNVVFRSIWRRDVAQRQVNVETTLCTSELKFITLNNIETTLCILKLNWTTLDNVVTTLSFQRQFSQRWANPKQHCKYDNWKKKLSLDSQRKSYFWASRNILDSKSSSFFSILREICKKIFVEPQKFLKHLIYWITKSIFKPSHFIKCWLVFNFKRQVQAHDDYCSFNFICIF